MWYTRLTQMQWTVIAHQTAKWELTRILHWEATCEYIHNWRAAAEISGVSEAACIPKQILRVKYNSNWDDHYHLCSYPVHCDTASRPDHCCYTNVAITVDVALTTYLQCMVWSIAQYYPLLEMQVFIYNQINLPNSNHFFWNSLLWRTLWLPILSNQNILHRKCTCTPFYQTCLCFSLVITCFVYSCVPTHGA